MKVKYHRKKKPFIAVSGDDDGHVYVLIPDSPNTNNWQYTKHVVRTVVSSQ